MTKEIKKTNKEVVSTLNYRIVPFETAFSICANSIVTNSRGAFQYWMDKPSNCPTNKIEV